MQLILLGLVLGLFLHDYEVVWGGGGAQPLLAWPWLLAVVIGPKLLLAGGYYGLCRYTLGRLGSGRPAAAMRRHEGISGAYRLAVLGLFILDLALGALLAVRAFIGDWILLDELIMLAPALGMFVWAWWAYYPLERRIREASLIGQLDAGLPLYTIWTRGQFVLAQVRHQMALILAPALLLLGWVEIVDRLGPAHWAVIDTGTQPLMIMAGALVIFLLAPLIIRHLWDTVPLPEGEMRQRLVAMCQHHRVGVRELLLWRTFGGVINAAVMGLVAPLRYILLSDALLESVRREQVEAVMAHELAHVRRHHMFWLLIVALSTLGTLELMFGLTFGMLQTALPAPRPPAVMQAGLSLDGLQMWLQSSQALVIITAVTAGGSWLVVFGWVSRRIERQADTFAVQHLAAQRDDPPRDTSGRPLIDAGSTQTMIDALQQVAVLNHIPIKKRSWRHGSIAWRQQYLHRLVGQPVDATPIDRQMRRIKIGASLALILIIAAQPLMQYLLR